MKPPPQRRLGRALVRLVGPLLLVLVIARMKDPGGLLRALGRASLWPLLAAVLLNLVNIHLKIVRWDVILRTRGIHYPRRRAWGAFLTSLYVGLLTPGRVGDLLRAQYLRHDLDVPYAEGVASVVVDRLCDLYVLVAFVAVGVVRYAPVIAGRLAVVTWVGVAATALGPLVLLVPGVAERLLGRVYVRLVPGGEVAGLTRFLAAIRASVGRPLLLTMPLTVLTFGVNYLQGWLIARALGLPMTFFDATCLLAIASLLGLLPISVSGVGVRELFFSLAFPLLGFTPDDGIVFGLLVFFVIYLIIVAVGFVSWQISPPPSAPAEPLDKVEKAAHDARPLRVRVRAKLREVADAMDAFSARLGYLAVEVIFWPVAYATTAGAGVFVIRHLSWLPLIDTNKVPTADTVKMVFWTVGAFVGIILIYVATMLARRIRRGSSGGLATMAEVNRRLRPILALPLLPTLTHAAIERDSPKETFLFIALCALAVGAGAYAWLRPAGVEGAAAAPRAGDAPDVPDAPPRARPLRENLARACAGVAVAGLWAAYGAFFSWLSILNHHALNTRTIDLGYYDNIFYQSIHGHPLACSFIKAGYHGSAHFDPLLVLLSPVYLAYPRAELLLGLQAVWLGAGVVPAYLLARDKLGSRLAGVTIAAMYAMYPALHGANMYDFHSLTLLSPILLTLLYFLEIGAYRRYYLTLIPALLCREDVALLMCFVGAYAIHQHRPRLTRLGWITIVASLVYFAIVKRFFMTSADIFMSGKDSYSFAYYYDDLIPNHNGVGGIVVSLVTNPVFVLRTMFTEAKLLYLITLFLPVAFLPFLARPGRVMLLYGMLFCLLASRGPVFSVHFQYSSVIIPIAFALTPVVLRRIQDGDLAGSLRLDGRRLSGALLAGALAASLLVSWKFGGVVDNQTFKGGFVRVARELTDKDRELYAWVRGATDKIPIAASVGLTNRTGAHASNRMRAYFYPERQDVDYLFLDEAELKGADLDKHTKNVSTGAFVLVDRRDKLAVFKKK